MEGNEKAIETYRYVKDQVITAGMGQPIGLNLLAVQFVMELLEVPPDEQEITLDKVLSAWHHIASIERAEHEGGE